MSDYARIEPETETHRLEKALTHMVGTASLPLAHGRVQITVGDGLSATTTGQHLLTFLVHLLARMKGVIGEIAVVGLEDVDRLPGVPLLSDTLFAGLDWLVDSLRGPASGYRTELRFGPPEASPDVRVAIGSIAEPADLTLGADAWRALLGSYAERSRWLDLSPIGAYFAAALGATEVFKRLLGRNFGWQEGHLVEDLAFSLFDFSLNDRATASPDVAEISLHDLAIAGAGAGGTAALYTLASFPALVGALTVVEPGWLKISNLGRYLMTTYDQVHAGIHKLDSVGAFGRNFAPGLTLQLERCSWHEVSHPWGTVICSVDTPEARWDVQRSGPTVIIEAGVVDLLYSVLRVVPGGWCLECKHPRDPELTARRRAARWGLSLDEVKRRFVEDPPVTMKDLDRLADVQGRPVEDFLPLLGKGFRDVPSLTECGETPLALAVPSQAPVLPLVTSAAGVVLAAEVVKDMAGIGSRLNNSFDHDLRFIPKPKRQVFRSRRLGCPACGSV